MELNFIMMENETEEKIVLKQWVDENDFKCWHNKIMSLCSV